MTTSSPITAQKQALIDLLGPGLPTQKTVISLDGFFDDDAGFMPARFDPEATAEGLKKLFGQHSPVFNSEPRDYSAGLERIFNSEE